MQPSTRQSSMELTELRHVVGLLIGNSFGVGATLVLAPLISFALPVPFFNWLLGGFFGLLSIGCIFGVIRVVGRLSDETSRRQRRVTMRQIRKTIAVLFSIGLCFAGIFSMTGYFVFASASPIVAKGKDIGMSWALFAGPFFLAMSVGHPLAKWYWFRYEVPALRNKHAAR